MDKFIRSLDKNFKVTLSNSSAYFYNGDLIIDYYKNKLFISKKNTKFLLRILI